MKYKLFFMFIFFMIFSCKSPFDKVEKINSKSNFQKNILPPSALRDKSNLDKDQLADSIKNVLLINKTAIVPHSWNDVVEKINFKDSNDTISLANIFVNSPSGGIPLNFSYPVKENDIIFYNIKNHSNNKLNSLTISEGELVRFKKEDFSKKDSINSSLIVTSDNSLNVVFENNNPIKNIGLFPSQLELNLKKLSRLSFTSEIIIDTIPVIKKIVETKFDTIFNIEQNIKSKLGSRLNLKEVKENLFPITVNTKDSLIGWSYWIGLKATDTITVNDQKNNPLSIFSLSELNNVKTQTNKIVQLNSFNDDLEILFENYTFDRRSLNFSKNYSFFRVDNSFSNELRQRALIKLINNSTLYDYDIQFIVASISLRSSKFEVEKEILELKKFIKLTLIGS